MINEKQIKRIIRRNIKCSHYKTFNEMQDAIKLGNALLVGLDRPLQSFTVPKVQLIVLNNMLVPLFTQHIMAFLRNYDIAESFVKEVNICVSARFSFLVPWLDSNSEPMGIDRMCKIYCNHLLSVGRELFSSSEEIVAVYITQRIKEYHMTLGG